MAINTIAFMCVKPKIEHVEGSLPKLRLPHKIAPILDLITGIAILTIGILGATGILAMSPALSYCLIGAGATYAGIMVLGIAIRCKMRSQCSRDKFLC